jgi:hypothetical protein
MKLVFYKMVRGGDGRPTARRVITVKAADPATADRNQLPMTLQARMAYWRQFADFFEIVQDEKPGGPSLRP